MANDAMDLQPKFCTEDRYIQSMQEVYVNTIYLRYVKLEQKSAGSATFFIDKLKWQNLRNLHAFVWVKLIPGNYFGNLTICNSDPNKK